MKQAVTAELRRQVVGLGKRTIQGILLGLVACTGLFAQNTTTVRVGLTSNDTAPLAARFLVDGQVYSSQQIFFWPIGSTHTVQFPKNAREDGGVDDYQLHYTGLIRYFWGQGWGANSDAGDINDNPLNPGDSSVRTFRVTSQLTDISASVSVEYFVRIRFNNPYPSSAGCGDKTIAVDDVRRQGYVLVDSTCYQTDTDLWMAAGSHTIGGFGYIGHVYNGTYVNNVLTLGPSDTSFQAVYQLTLNPLFITSKRVHFRTDTVGMQIIVDHTPVTPTPFALDIQNDPINQNSACNPTSSALPVTVPSNTQPYCIGDFDFFPNSQHQISAAVVQLDVAGRRFVFDSFSTGTPNNGTYTANDKVYEIDTVLAHFVPGIVTNLTTIPAGLHLGVDGAESSPFNTFGLAFGSGSALFTGNTYGFVWGLGHKHIISAPLLQTDSQGRKWKFSRWSDGGTASHEITVMGALDTGMSVTAYFEPLGQIQLTSVPAGINFTVNGAVCTTPCTYDQDADTKLTIVAPKQVLVGSTTRRDFASWSGGSTALSRDVTFTKDVQVINAGYSTSYLVQVDTDPGGAATISYNATSPDGFYLDGTNLQVTVAAKQGFKFRRWSGDLSGTSPSGTLTVNAPKSIVALFDKVPFISPTGVQNSAGDNPNHTVAPGSIITIYGDGLSATTEVGPSSQLAQALGSVYVTIGDRILPLIFVSPKQINAQLFSDLGDGTYTIIVHNTGNPDIPGTLKVQRDAPGIYINYTPDGKPFAAALHEDGTAITQDSPVRRGETISLYTTGLGPYDHTILDGFAIPALPVYKVVDEVRVTFAVPQTAKDPSTAATDPASTDTSTSDPSAAAPATTPDPIVRFPTSVTGVVGMVGISTINVKIDTDLPSGNLLEISVYSKLPQGDLIQSNKAQIPVQ